MSKVYLVSEKVLYVDQSNYTKIPDFLYNLKSVFAELLTLKPQLTYLLILDSPTQESPSPHQHAKQHNLKKEVVSFVQQNIPS